MNKKQALRLRRIAATINPNPTTVQVHSGQHLDGRRSQRITLSGQRRSYQILKREFKATPRPLRAEFLRAMESVGRAMRSAER